MNFSQKIGERMKIDKISKTALAKKMGCSTSYLSDILAGRKRWNEDTLSKACKALDLVIEIRGKDPKECRKCS